MSKLDYIGCIVKTIVILALVASDLASFAILLFIFMAYVYVPKLIRDFRSLHQTPTETRAPDS